MHKRIIIGCILVLLIGILFFVFRKEKPITNYPSNGTTIVALGDSLFAGIGATAGNDLPSLLEKLSGQEIINMGISGNTTAQGLARVEEVIEKNPKVVLVLLGGNDFLRKVPIDETFKNIDDIVTRIQSTGAVVVLLGVRGGLLSDPYEERFEEIAKNRGTLYVSDVLDGILTNRKYMSDAIHPNDAGYQKIADRVYLMLEKALE